MVRPHSASDTSALKKHDQPVTDRLIDLALIVVAIVAAVAWWLALENT